MPSRRAPTPSCRPGTQSQPDGERACRGSPGRGQAAVCPRQVRGRSLQGPGQALGGGWAGHRHEWQARLWRRALGGPAPPAGSLRAPGSPHQFWRCQWPQRGDQKAPQCGCPRLSEDMAGDILGPAGSSGMDRGSRSSGRCPAFCILPRAADAGQGTPGPRCLCWCAPIRGARRWPRAAGQAPPLCPAGGPAWSPRPAPCGGLTAWTRTPSAETTT